ncbi:hypothetical protein HHI36_017674 [Cryptolaemus montrouzieri]|uniref:Choline kinase n=1 Tax=Cryptolaemus montrouzieri TaxID=559131 RepID=A0ABD2NNP0_9CUCU
MKEVALNVCKNFLLGVWTEAGINDLQFNRISGGLSNLLYLVSLPEYLHDKIKDEPKEVLLRLYGEYHPKDDSESLQTESVIFALLGERGIGPKLYGLFPGGRIEEYIHAKSLKIEDLSDERILKKIAQKMAFIHSLEFPIEKQPKWVWKTMERWLEICEKSTKTRRFIKSENINLRVEYKWLREKVEKERIPVVFCHNDINEGNILLKSYHKYDPTHPKISIIDSEYCAYNYRAFEIANFFLEWTYDYTTKEYPYFTLLDNYPLYEQRFEFVKEYLSHMKTHEDPEKLLVEVKLFTLVSHYFWALWSLANMMRTDILFGYYDFGVIRTRAYLKKKRQFQNEKAI